MNTVAILAGGLATRLKPLTEKIPKALVDVNGEPFIFHQLRLLKKNGIDRAVLCVAHLGHLIEERVGNGRAFGLEVLYSDDGDDLLGTGGALKKALPLLGPAFFVLYGDSYLTCDFQAVGRAFEAGGKWALMTVLKNQGAWDTSNVEFTDGEILVYDKKNRTARMEHIDYGLGVFRAEAFSLATENGPCDLAALYQELLKKGQLAAYEIKERFYEIGSHEGLEETRRFLAQAGNRVV